MSNITKLGNGYDNISNNSNKPAITLDEVSTKEKQNYSHLNLRLIETKEDYIRTIAASLDASVNVGPVSANVNANIDQ